MKAFKAAIAFAAGVGLSFSATTAMAAACANPNAIGVSRTVQIDTTGGPGFGFEHYKANDFLQNKEVVLTFDDGPQKFSTEMVLAALADHCTKATFFSIGKMALGYPEIIREVAKAGHTIGSHTFSHKAIRKLKTFEEGRDEIERGVSAVRRAVGGPVAPFFRYPTLVDTPETIAMLGKRNIAMFSTDIDSFDFKIQTPESIVKTVMTKLDKQGKGIVLMHDIHKTTAKAVPLLLNALKAGGYKIVHLKAKGEVTTLAEFDQAIEKDAKGLPQTGAEKPVSSIVKTIEGDAPEAERGADAAPQPAAAPAQSQPAPAAAPASPPKAENKPAAPAAPRAEAPAPAQPEEEPTEQAAAPQAEPATAPQAAKDEPAPETYTPKHIQSAEASIPSTVTGSTEHGAAAAPADSVKAEPKSWKSKAVEIWQMWFGK